MVINMMDGVDLPNDTGNSGKWRIWMPDGSTRLVKGSVSSGIWITAVAHGKYMDVIPVGSVSGSSSTNYCDIYYISTASSRVVYRGYYYAYPYGGVSMSNAAYDSSVRTRTSVLVWPSAAGSLRRRAPWRLKR